MSWTPRAWPLALLAFTLLPACPSGDDEGTGPNDDTAASADGSAALGCAAGVTAGSSPDPVMLTWGAACTSNEECIDLIGDPAAVCDFTAVVYELPGGYCTKPCTLPDGDTRAVPDDPNCDPAGGVTCIGVMGTFERCAVPCTDSQQCNREGYECRQLPLVSGDNDPSFCLMPECCDLNSCDD